MVKNSYVFYAVLYFNINYSTKIVQRVKKSIVKDTDTLTCSIREQNEVKFSFYLNYFYSVLIIFYVFILLKS